MITENEVLGIPENVDRIVKSVLEKREKIKVKIDRSLSVDEMNVKIDELRMQAYRLDAEIMAYRTIIEDVRLKKEIEERTLSVGKCYKRKYDANRKQQNPFAKSINDVYAFKIMAIGGEDRMKCRYAICICLFKGEEDIGIAKSMLPIWKSVSAQLNGNQYIDAYEEISSNEFRELLEEFCMEMGMHNEWGN